jgi:hypothetical protein
MSGLTTTQSAIAADLDAFSDTNWFTAAYLVCALRIVFEVFLMFSDSCVESGTTHRTHVPNLLPTHSHLRMRKSVRPRRTRNVSSTFVGGFHSGTSHYRHGRCWYPCFGDYIGAGIDWKEETGTVHRYDQCWIHVWGGSWCCNCRGTAACCWMGICHSDQGWTCY